MSIQSMVMSNNAHNVQILLQTLYKDDEKRSPEDKKLPKLINKCDKETGDTPLISALRVGNWDIVSLLMKYGADPMAENQSHEIPARIKSPIRSLFISEYLNRSYFDKEKAGTQSLTAVASDVLLSSLNNSYNRINSMLSSCQLNPQCANCKSAKAIIYHKKCKHLVLCQFCYDKLTAPEDTNNLGNNGNNTNNNDNSEKKKINTECPICQEQYSSDDFILTKYIMLNGNIPWEKKEAE